MKNLILKTKFVMMSLLIVLFISCDGEDGAMGPAGQNGIDGTDGANGSDGQDGNANVIASAWIASGFSTTATSFTSFDVVDSNITEEVINSAAILAYGKLSSDQIISIPYVFRNESYYIAPIVSSNTMRFLANSIDGTTEVFNDVTEVRYVIIPSNNITKSSGIDFTKMSYQEVMDRFGLAY